VASAGLDSATEPDTDDHRRILFLLSFNRRGAAQLRSGGTPPQEANSMLNTL
jgi:hypothetical protein